MRYRQPVVVLAIVLSMSVAPTAWPVEPVTGDRGGDMLVDLVVLRPLGLASTVLGSAVFVLALPFTLASGTVADSACQLVQRPAAYTFARPLGDLAVGAGPDGAPCAQADPARAP